MKSLKIIPFAVVLMVFAISMFVKSSKTQSSSVELAEKRLTPPATHPVKEGIAVMILLDSSGSMEDDVADSKGSKSRKISVASRCVENTVKQIVGYAQEDPKRTIVMGIDAFSGSENDVRTVIPLGTPKTQGVAEALKAISPKGGTPIGDAIVQAKIKLDAAGFNRSHILIVTDGDNTVGLNPEHVMAAMNRFPENTRPNVYFVAFDVSANVFQPLSQFGATVLPASDEKQLQSSLDMLIGEKIMLEN